MGTFSAANAQRRPATGIDGYGRLICYGTRLGAGQTQSTSGLVHPPPFIPYEASGCALPMGSRRNKYHVQVRAAMGL